MRTAGSSELPTQPDLSTRRSGLSARDFQLFQRLIHREAGIHLVESKRVLVEGRLSRRLRELGLDFRAYYALLETDEAERVRLVDAISTNETHFFREPRQFEFLESRVFPRWLARAEQGQMSRRVRVWSAACSTGEEPYSVAMSFLAHFPPGSGWEIEILATDISTRVLDRARAALCAARQVEGDPRALPGALHAEGHGRAGGLDEGGAGDPLAGPLRPREPERRRRSRAGPVRPDPLPERAHLLRRALEGARASSGCSSGSTPAAIFSWATPKR